MTVFFSAKDIVLFVQPQGPGTKVSLVSCVGLGDVEIPESEPTAQYCEGINERGDYRLISITNAPPAMPTTEVTLRLSNTKSFFDALCPNANMFALASQCLNPSVFAIDSTGIMLQLQNVGTTSKTYNALSPLGEDGESIVTFPVTSKDIGAMLHLYLTLVQLTTAAVSKANDTAIVTEACASGCNAKVGALEIYYVTQDAVSLASAKLLFRDKNNIVPIATTADPFAADENISGVELFSIGVSTLRVMVASGTTDAGAPAKVAIADVDITLPGTTVWSIISIGAVNGEFMPTGNSLLSLNDGTSYAVTDGGSIHKSSDKGITWTTLASNTSTQLNVIKAAENRQGMPNKNVLLAAGNTNTIRKTTNGGKTWQTVTGSSGQAAAHILSAHIFNANEFWVGYSDGKLFNTKNGGKEWTEFVLPKSATINDVATNFVTVDRVNDIDFIDTSVGMLTGMVTDGSSDEFGMLWKTVDGGYTWETHVADTTFSSATPEGFTSVSISSENTALTAGDPITTTAIFSLDPPTID